MYIFFIFQSTKHLKQIFQWYYFVQIKQGNIEFKLQYNNNNNWLGRLKPLQRYMVLVASLHQAESFEMALEEIFQLKILALTFSLYLNYHFLLQLEMVSKFHLRICYMFVLFLVLHGIFLLFQPKTKTRNMMWIVNETQK